MGVDITVVCEFINVETKILVIRVAVNNGPGALLAGSRVIEAVGVAEVEAPYEVQAAERQSGR
jgi:hypothetical protein